MRNNAEEVTIPRGEIFLRFPLAVTEGVDGAGLTVGQFDASELLFILDQVLLERHGQAFSMFGCEDDTATDDGLGHAWHHLCTVDHEFTTGMRNNGEIGVYTLRHVGRHLNLELLALILVVIIHCYWEFRSLGV